MRANIVWSVLALITALSFGLIASARMHETCEGVPNITVCAQNLTVIGSAIELYKQDHDDLPKSLAELVPKYLVEVAVCPSTKKDTYSVGYRRIAGGYSLRCTVTEHSPVSRNRPFNDSRTDANANR